MKKKFSKKPLWYLANPFTHKLKKVRKQRVKDCTEATIRLLSYNIQTFTPIAYNGSWHEEANLPCEWEFWEKYDKNFLERCDGLLVLMLSGWQDSVGVKAEIRHAEKLGMPVLFIDLEDVDSSKNIQRILDSERYIQSSALRKLYLKALGR